MHSNRRTFAWAVLAILAAGALTLQQAASGFLLRALAVDLVLAIVAALVAWPRVRWLMPAIVPLLVAAVLGQFAPEGGVSLSVVVPAVLGTALLLLLAAGVDVGPPIDAAIHALGRLIELLAGAVAFCLLVIPGWAWSRLRHRDPLATGGETAPTWSAWTGARATPTSLAASPEVVGARRTPTGRLTWAIGCVVVLLAANYGVGWTWDQAFPTDAATAPSTGGPERVVGAVPRDPRTDTPAMAAYPWRERYFDDLQRTTNGYWPYTENRPEDFSSPYINQRGWRRTTYRPKGDLASMPTAWMFGGSTTWGEGQRDEYTIASWLGRLSEAAGTPLRVVNYGERGWTHFQEMILYEQELALRPKPDLSIFYDGANEITTQSLLDVAVPSNILAYTYAQKLRGSTIGTEFAQRPADTAVPSLVWEKYREHSAVHKIVDYFQAPAQAAPDQDPSSVDPGNDFTGGQDQGANGLIENYDVTPQDGTDAGRVYERGKKLTIAISKDHGVRPFFFWQPVRVQWEATDNARAELTPSTTDISDALDGHDDVYIDGGHTNEQGARIVAERIWKRIAPAVERWYREAD